MLQGATQRLRPGRVGLLPDERPQAAVVQAVRLVPEVAQRGQRAPARHHRTEQTQQGPGQAGHAQILIVSQPALLTRHRLLVRPQAKAFGGETFPGEQWPRIKLAQRRDVAVTDDVPRADAVAFADVLEQDDQRLNLRFAIRVPEAPGRCVFETGIDDFNTDRAGVEPGAALPLASAGGRSGQ